MFLLSQSTHRMVIQYHPEIGHLYVPNLLARIPNERGGYYVRTNAQGFRSDTEFSQARGNRPRILFFGDSFTAGDGCSNGERFSDRIGEELDAEVYNYGLSGSGTDQQLLIFERLAAEIPADLIVFCVAVHNIERITYGYREAIDRARGHRILVPKPYFTLENGQLALHHVPVPRERPPAESAASDQYHSLIPNGRNGIYRLLEPLQDQRRLAQLRAAVQERLPGIEPEIKSWLLRRSGFQPHAGYQSETSPAWQLMEALLNRFIAGASPVPVLLVPIPTDYFYRFRVPAIYQELFQRLEAPERGVHVADATSPLCRLPRDERARLSFQYDGHFSPFGHQKLAEVLKQAIISRGLLPQRSSVTVAAETKAAEPPRPKNSGKSSRPAYILGLSCFYHNSAAALVKDGAIVAAAEEERFTRIKNDRRFPHLAANYCLEQAGIQQDDLAAVVYYDNAPLTFERLLHTQLAVRENGENSWLQVMPSWVRYKLHLPQLIRRYLCYEGPVLHNRHHRSHAASAFFPSPFDRAAILTIDGVGEWATASIGVGEGSEIRILKEMHFPHSLGLLYSAFTQFTGFKVNSGEYKMMGLAPYGEPRYVDTIYEHLVDLKEDGSLELNLDCFAYLAEPTMTNEGFAALFGGPARKPEEWITQREMDLARSIQVVAEEAMLRMARHAQQLTDEKNLCLAGGVALNCVANGRILREGPFEQLWIQPAAGDSGCALGAALDVYHGYLQKPRSLTKSGRPLQGGSYLGPSFSADEIRAFLQTHGCPFHPLTPEDRAQRIADLLATGKVVGHFAGRTEFGPRALGARSILGDPRNEEMQVNLNLKIKYRESFRPFAPTVLAERVAEYFELDRESPYMLLVAPVKAERCLPFERPSGTDLLQVVRQSRSDIPAVTHIDYSARVQTIAREDHPEYYDLIAAFEHATGCGVLVNTSFNVRGEPIVCTPDDAYRCFMGTEMDALVLGDFLLLKEEQPPHTQPKGHIEENEDKLPELFEAPFLTGLKRLYRSGFLPMAERLAEKDAIRISLQWQRRPSTWEEAEPAQNDRSVFEIPAELDTAKGDPVTTAAAITRFWQPGTATDYLRSFLADLLRLGQRHPEQTELAETVSDSIYVMH